MQQVGITDHVVRSLVLQSFEKLNAQCFGCKSVLSCNDFPVQIKDMEGPYIDGIFTVMQYTMSFNTACIHVYLHFLIASKPPHHHLLRLMGR